MRLNSGNAGVALVLAAGMTAGVAGFSVAGQSSWGSVLNSAAQVAVQSLTPQAQQAVEQAKALGTPAKQENFLVTKAKEYLAAGNYQPALDLGNYVVATLNSKSVDAKKIVKDAKDALLKMAKDKADQATQASKVGADVQQTATGVKNLLGSFGTAK